MKVRLQREKTKHLPVGLLGQLRQNESVPCPVLGRFMVVLVELVHELVHEVLALKEVLRGRDQRGLEVVVKLKK